jgi:hypothetical protein
MNDATIELLLYRILSGTLFFFYQGEKYELKSANYSIRYESQLLYNQIINEEKYGDWIREEDIVSVMINLGIWTTDTMTIIKNLEKKIDNIKVDLFKSSILPDRLKVHRKNLNNTRSQLNQILNKKSDLMSNTLEGYATSIKNEYVICNTLYKNNKRVFTKNIENNQSSYTYFNDLVNELNQHSISLTEFKAIARHQLWKSYWNCNKQNIFHDSIINITDDQRTLINISRMYDSVYEHPDAPSDQVIEDDDMLEGWMILQRRKADQTKNQNKVDNLNPKLKNAQEVFLMADSAESYEEIMSLNSPEGKYRMQEKIGFINNASGPVSDLQLPDVRRELLNKSNEMTKNRK